MPNLDVAKYIFNPIAIWEVFYKMDDFAWVRKNYFPIINKIVALFVDASGRCGLNFEDFADHYFNRDAEKYARRILEDPEKWQPIYLKADEEIQAMARYGIAVVRMQVVFGQYQELSNEIILGHFYAVADILGGFEIPVG